MVTFDMRLDPLYFQFVLMSLYVCTGGWGVVCALWLRHWCLYLQLVCLYGPGVRFSIM